MNKVLVCGSRDFYSYHFLDYNLKSILEPLGKNVTIIQGGAKGADFLAKCFAKIYNLEEVEVPANWKETGKSAGPIRNQKMLDLNPDIVVAFPTKNSRGTKDMILRARKKGTRVYVFDYYGDFKE